MKTYDPNWKEITCLVPGRFVTLAASFCLQPEHLMKLLAEDFADNPPREIVIIARKLSLVQPVDRTEAFR